MVNESVENVFALSKIKRLGHIINKEQLENNNIYECSICNMNGIIIDNKYSGKIFNFICGSEDD